MMRFKTKYSHFKINLIGCLSFSNKNVTDGEISIGILGESRYDKGFYKVPELIRYLNDNLNKKINFIIQINNYPQNLSLIHI